jgi:DNA-binding MarR family transcriptional regulator
MGLEPGESRPMGAFASEVGCDASTATWLIDRLEDRGLVERRPSPTDRRVKGVVLTQRGAQVRAELKDHYATPPEALSNLDDDVLDRMLEILAQLNPEPAAAGSAQ